MTAINAIIALGRTMGMYREPMQKMWCSVRNLCPARAMMTKIVASLILTLTLTACGMAGGPVKGKVIDQTTGKPIEGAIVVAYWQGQVPMPAETQTTCYHVESTTTDKDGTYRTPFWFALPQTVMNPKIAVIVYQPGYDHYQGPETPHEKRLTPFTGTREERLEYLRKLHAGCPGAKGTYKNLYLIRNSVYEEAVKLAVTDNDKKIVKVLHRYAKSALEED
ncbi:MAG: carboxypeptidase-like regulatory domain-containing protein [Gammaproteobacteria bacterium]|nr:carboxypeptidase-like regulatory domain-containing protein [Gammaproteobacteria bacterium]